MADTDIVLTAHAEDMLVERNIDRSWVEATIHNPATLEADPAQAEAFRAFRRIPERGNRYLRIVYIREVDCIRVITAFFDRGQSK